MEKGKEAHEGETGGRPRGGRGAGWLGAQLAREGCGGGVGGSERGGGGG